MIICLVFGQYVYVKKIAHKIFWGTDFDNRVPASQQKLERSINWSFMIHMLLESYKTYCSWTFLIYLFLRFVGVSYGWFVAVRFGFNLSTYIQNRWWKVGGERFKWQNRWELITDASNPVWSQSHTGVV